MTRNATRQIPALIATAATNSTALLNQPNVSVARTAADNAVDVIAADPRMISSRRLLSRARMGSGRLLRGTAHTESIAFWTACPTPRPP